jgi:hypothetical protein
LSVAVMCPSPFDGPIIQVGCTMSSPIKNNCIHENVIGVTPL